MVEQTQSPTLQEGGMRRCARGCELLQHLRALLLRGQSESLQLSLLLRCCHCDKRDVQRLTATAARKLQRNPAIQLLMQQHALMLPMCHKLRPRGTNGLLAQQSSGIQP